MPDIWRGRKFEDPGAQKLVCHVGGFPDQAADAFEDFRGFQHATLVGERAAAALKGIASKRLTHRRPNAG